MVQTDYDIILNKFEDHFGYNICKYDKNQQIIFVDWIYKKAEMPTNYFGYPVEFFSYTTIIEDFRTLFEKSDRHLVNYHKNYEAIMVHEDAVNKITIPEIFKGIQVKIFKDKMEFNDE